MRVGIFGGTFDPVHYGHLILAEQSREQAGLDQVLFVPSARPPHKKQQPLTPFAQRAEMLNLAISGNFGFKVDELEKDRPGPSYTIHTLEEIHARQPGDQLFMIIGSDSLHDLPFWYQPQAILELAGLLVTPRSDWMMLSIEELRTSLRLPASFSIQIQVIQAPPVGIASRDLRRRAAQGRSLRYLVPRAVEAFIHDKALYRDAS